MKWQGWLAIVLVLLTGFVVASYLARKSWVEKDVERQTEIAQLRLDAEKHGAEAAQAARRVAAANHSATASHAAMKAAQDELEAMRRKWGNRPTATDVATLQAQVADADLFIAKLESTISIADLTIASLAESVVAYEEQVGSLELQVRANEAAWLAERKRSEAWRRQTKMGRVKTAFFGIGMGVAGGLAGYGVGSVTQ